MKEKKVDFTPNLGKTFVLQRCIVLWNFFLSIMRQNQKVLIDRAQMSPKLYFQHFFIHYRIVLFVHFANIGNFTHKTQSSYSSSQSISIPNMLLSHRKL